MATKRNNRSNKPKQRILIKLSGAALKGDNDRVVSVSKAERIVKQIAELHKEYNVGIVCGGGNIWRGEYAKIMDRRHADYLGMVSTVINANFIHSVLKKYGIASTVFSNFPVPIISRPLDLFHFEDVLNKNEVVLFAGGTGTPFFTTDTAAVLRAIDMQCDVVMFGKDGVDGVYSDDPFKNKKAKFYPKLTYAKAMSENLKVMDQTAFSLASSHNLKLIVFNLDKPDSLVKALKDDKYKKTIITGGK